MFVFDSLADSNADRHILVILEVQDVFNFISHVDVLFESNKHHMIPGWRKHKFLICVHWYSIYNLCAVLKLRYLRRIRRHAGPLIPFWIMIVHR